MSAFHIGNLIGGNRSSDKIPWDALDYSGSVITAISGSALVGQGGDTSQCFPATASSLLQPSGDYAYNSALSGYLPASASGDFITSTAGLAPSGDYAYNSAVSGKLDASASSQFYLATNPSGFISSSYTPTFGYDGSKISSIDGSALVGEGAGTGIEYSGIAPVVVNNTSHEISADTINFVLDSSLSGNLSNSQYTLSINKEAYTPVQVVSSTSLATANGVIYVVSQ